MTAVLVDVLAADIALAALAVVLLVIVVGFSGVPFRVVWAEFMRLNRRFWTPWRKDQR